MTVKLKTKFESARHKLGTIPDSLLAKEVGVSDTTILRWRRMFKIPAYSELSGPINDNWVKIGGHQGYLNLWKRPEGIQEELESICTTRYVLRDG